MSLEGHSDMEIHFCETLGLKISQAKMQIMNAEVFQLPIKFHIFREREDLFFPPHSFLNVLLFSSMRLLLDLYESCSDAVFDGDLINHLQESCGRLVL